MSTENIGGQYGDELGEVQNLVAKIDRQNKVFDLLAPSESSYADTEGHIGSVIVPRANLIGQGYEELYLGNDAINSDNKKTLELNSEHSRDITIGVVSALQSEYFRRLVELGEEIPYEQYGIDNVEATEEARTAGGAYKQFLEDEGYEGERVQAVREDITKIISIANDPEFEKRVIRAAQIRLDNISARESELRKVSDNRNRDMKASDEKIIAVGQAWPLPRAIGDTTLSAILESQESDQIFPSPSTTREVAAEGRANGKGGGAETQNERASQDLAEFLAVNRGEIYTLPMLGRNMNYADTDDNRTLGERARLRIRDYRDGTVKVMKELFERHGLMLQEGTLTEIEVLTGKNIIPPRKVYRAVSENDERLGDLARLNNDSTVTKVTGWKVVEPGEGDGD